MKFQNRCLFPTLLVAIFACCIQKAQAMPKAAEYEDAPVTAGVNVAPPRPSAKSMNKKKTDNKSSHTIKAKSDKKTKHPAKAAQRKK